MRVVLAILALVLVGILVVQWRDRPPVPADLASPVAETPLTPLTPKTPVGELLPPPPPKDEYVSVKERPLFLPDRRPAPEEEEPEPETEPDVLTELDNVDLNAVLITPTLVSAWVRSPSAQEMVRLRLGDEFEGWTVQLIEPHRVVFQRQEETGELVLRDYSKAPPVLPKTPVRPSPARRQQREATPPPQGSPQPQTSAQPPTPPPGDVPGELSPAEIAARRDRASSRSAGGSPAAGQVPPSRQ